MKMKRKLTVWLLILSLFTPLPSYAKLITNTPVDSHSKEVLDFIFERLAPISYGVVTNDDQQIAYRFSENGSSGTLVSAISFPKVVKGDHKGRFTALIDMGSISNVDFQRIRQVDDLIYDILSDWCLLRNADDIIRGFSDQIILYLYEGATKPYKWNMGNLSLQLEYTRDQEEGHNHIGITFCY